MPADAAPREAPVSLRLSPEIIERAERVREAAGRAAGPAPISPPSRHAVLLAAIDQGLRALEMRYRVRVKQAGGRGGA